MSYLPNVPQAGDLISDSQSDLLTNFQQLDLVYGDTAPGADPNSDHYAFSNATANARKHRKVRLVRQSAGAGIPTPAATDGVVYARVAATQTVPFYRKDGGTLDFPVIPVRSMIRFTRAAAPVVIGTAFNATVASIGGNPTNFRITFAENMPDANYLLFGGIIGNDSSAMGFANVLVNTFDILGVSTNVTEVMVTVLHYA